MIESAANLQYWHWLVFGLALLLAEVAVAGTTFLMWIGLCALAVGALTFVLPSIIVWQVQLLVFGVGSVGSVLLWKRYFRDKETEQAPVLGRRGAQYIGRVVHLEEAIVGSQGRIRIDDTMWSVRGEDAPAGTAVRILAQDGNTFDVVRLD